MSNKVKHWKVIDPGDGRPERTGLSEYMCIKCMNESMLPTSGTMLAQMGNAVVFDIGKYWMPKTIRCPHCRTTLTLHERSEP